MSFSLAELIDTRRSYASRQSRDEKLRLVPFACVYVVSDGEAVLYVGSTQYGPRHRMMQHKHGRTRFDVYLRENLNRAAAWIVDAYRMPNLDTARLIEAVAIARLNPVFNDAVNVEAA